VFDELHIRKEASICIAERDTGDGEGETVSGGVAGGHAR
jgi:hypothetical protein